jgi:hypothetical protein
VEGAKTQPDQGEDVTAPEAPAGAAQGLELDLSTLDDDERVPPLGLDESPLAAWRHRDRSLLEGGRKWSRQEGESIAA